MEDSPAFLQDEEYYRKAYEFYRSQMVALVGAAAAIKVAEEWAATWRQNGTRRHSDDSDR